MDLYLTQFGPVLIAIRTGIGVLETDSSSGRMVLAGPPDDPDDPVWTIESHGSLFERVLAVTVSIGTPSYPGKTELAFFELEF